MAAHAVFVENRRDVLGVRDFAGRRLVAHPADVASNRLGHGLRHRFAGQHFVDRVDQIGRRLLAAGIADAELIVDPAPVPDDLVFVEHEGLRRADRAKLVGHAVAGILQQRELDFAIPRVAADLFQRVLPVGVDADELHAVLGIPRRHFLQPRAVELRQRALGAEKHDNDRLLVRPIRKRILRAKIILQREIVDLAADRRGRCIDAIRSVRERMQCLAELPRRKWREDSRPDLLYLFALQRHLS